MTPRERVLTALSHHEPDRVPFAWNFGPTPEMTDTMRNYLAAQGLSWHRLSRAVDDIRQVAPRYIGPALPPGQDIWGIVRRPHSYGQGSYNEIVHHPLAGTTDPGQLLDYPWPDPTCYDFAHLRQQVIITDPYPPRARKLAIDTCGNPFEIYCWMTGLEEALVNTLTHPELVHTALSKITDFFAAKMALALQEIGDLIDILYFADDLGGQTNLLLSRQTYREIIMPYHVRLFQLGRTLAPHAAVMYHSDGAVFDILPDLLEAGIEVLEAVQIDAENMNPRRLKATYGDRLAFHGGISVQSLLPSSDPDTVMMTCRELISIFGTRGGYIAAPTHAIQVGTPPENVIAMLHAVLGEEDYRAVIDDARVF